MAELINPVKIITTQYKQYCKWGTSLAPLSSFVQDTFRQKKKKKRSLNPVAMFMLLLDLIRGNTKTDSENK